MRVPVILCIRHDWGDHRGGLGEGISYALQCRVPISKELTSYPVNPGPLMWVPVILYIRYEYWERVLAMPWIVTSPIPIGLPAIM